MIVRKIKESELKRCSEVFHISFEFEMTDNRTNEEMLKEIKTDPKGRFDRFPMEKWAAFEDDDKTMMSCVTVTPYDVWFDTGFTKLSGMGGVSTLPQYRNSGGVRGCFSSSIKSMYDEDYGFSYLYPFSTAYYGRFGYASCGENILYSIPLRAIKKNPIAGGKCVLLESEKSYACDISMIYNDFVKGVNMACDRQDFDYDFIKNPNPAKTKEYSYIYYSSSNEPKGFISFKKEKRENGNFDMSCSKFLFTDSEGLFGLLNLAVSFGAYYDKLEFFLPSFSHIDLLFAEWALYPSERKIYYNGMVRVINVKKVLNMASYIGTGSIKLSVKDDILPQNDHVFLVEFANGVATRVCLTDERPDISMSIAEFSRFIVGSRDTQDLYIAPDVAIHNDVAALRQVFYKKKCLMLEGF